MEEVIRRKTSALRTMLEMMEAPEMRMDVSKPANIRWLHRNLRINNSDHPLFETAIELVVWLMKSGSRRAERIRPVC